MSIRITPENYYVGFWSFALPENTGNFLACAWRQPDESTTWHFQYRFRYYRDSKVFESDDERHWWEGTAKNKTQEQFEADFTRCMNQIALKAGAIVDFYAVRCCGAEMMDKLPAAPPPWMHVREMKKNG
jgi:hypothetical protein